MNRLKRKAFQGAVLLLLFLAFCTIASRTVHTLLLSEVSTLTLGEINSKNPSLQIPLYCVSLDEQGDPYVMRLLTRNGVFGTEYYVQKHTIVAVDQDLETMEVMDADLSGQTLAVYPSRILSPEEAVRIREP